MPVFHFHGHGSSRLEALMLEDAANRLGLRVIALDRPGIGRSDPKDGDRLLDWPDDVAEAADQLGLERFAVQGMSAGGPYALACAHQYPARVTACALVSAVPPPDIARRAGPRARRLAWWVAYRFPNYLRRRLQQFRPDDPPREDMVNARMLRVAQWLGGEDLRLMQIAELRAVLARTMMETARQDGAGNRDEIARLVQPWGFDIAHHRGPAPLRLARRRGPHHADRAGARRWRGTCATAPRPSTPARGISRCWSTAPTTCSPRCAPDPPIDFYPTAPMLAAGRGRSS